MSLLLDALKRAEEAKRAKLAADGAPASEQRGSQPSTLFGDTPTRTPVDKQSLATKPAAPELSIEDYKEVITPKPRPRPAPADVRQDEAPVFPTELTLENVSEAPVAALPPLRASSSGAPAGTVGTTSRLDATRLDAAQSRDTARTVFVAKQVSAIESGSSKKWLLPVVAAIVLLAAGGGWYVWNEVNRMSRPTAPAIASRSATPGALPPAQPATGQPGAKATEAVAPKPSSEPVEPPLPPLLPPPSTEAPLPSTVTSRTPVSGPVLTQREVLAKSLKEAPASKEAPVALLLARSIAPAAVNANLVEAYAALKSADYSRARNLYAKLLASDPLSIDAHLGMATVFARRGDPASAMNHYRQVLALDPRNGTALAGLLAVSDSRSPSLETELRTLVGRHPEASSLHFSLGNLYASERRWVEAQQAYFEAFRLESENADYIYNLAVSLDHLKKSKMAFDYYQRALVVAPKSGAQFDTSAVARRIKELSDQGNKN